jgi:hypothetical protein
LRKNRTLREQSGEASSQSSTTAEEHELITVREGTPARRLLRRVTDDDDDQRRMSAPAPSISPDGGSSSLFQGSVHMDVGVEQQQRDREESEGDDGGTVAATTKKLGIESLDYDIDASSLFETNYATQTAMERRLNILYRWVVCAVSGIATGALAFALDVGATQLQALKWNLAAAAAANHTASASASAEGFSFAAATATVLACSLLLVAVASSLVAFAEPIAGGSGVSEVKTYLQGVRIPRMLRVSTLLCKALGVLGSVSAGLVCGKEGPSASIRPSHLRLSSPLPS